MFVHANARAPFCISHSILVQNHRPWNASLHSTCNSLKSKAMSQGFACCDNSNRLIISHSQLYNTRYNNKSRQIRKMTGLNGLSMSIDFVRFNHRAPRLVFTCGSLLNLSHSHTACAFAPPTPLNTGCLKFSLLFLKHVRLSPVLQPNEQ